MLLDKIICVAYLLDVLVTFGMCSICKWLTPEVTRSIIHYTGNIQQTNIFICT